MTRFWSNLEDRLKRNDVSSHVSTVVKLITSRENVQHSKKKGKALVRSKSKGEYRRTYINWKLLNLPRNARILCDIM